MPYVGSDYDTYDQLSTSENENGLEPLLPSREKDTKRTSRIPRNDSGAFTRDSDYHTDSEFRKTDILKLDASQKPNSGEQVPDDASTGELDFYIQISGRAFTRDKLFWKEMLPYALLLGAAVGLAILIVLGGYRATFFGIFGSFGQRIDGDDDMLKIGSVGYFSGEWWWPFVTVFGNVLALSVLLLPGAPKHGEIQNLFQQIASLTVNTKHGVYIILCSWISLCVGAQLGSEMLAAGLGGTLGALCPGDDRSNKVLILAGMASAVGALFKNPFVGVMLMQELSIVARPNGIHLDLVERPGDSTPPRRVLYSHDYTEQIVILAAASIAGFVVLDSITGEQIEIDIDEQFELWHIPVAIPIGFTCGIITTFWVLGNAIFKKIRFGFSRKMKDCVPAWFPSLFFAGLAGLFYGVVGVAYPLTLGTGSEMLNDILDKGFNNNTDDGIMNGKDEIIAPDMLLISGFFKLLCSNCCIGFGLVGGTMVPLIFAGACLGLAIPHYITFLPKSLTVACFIMGMTAAVFPSQLIWVVMFAFFASAQPKYAVSVLTSCITAFATCGGLQLLPWLKERKRKRNGENTDEEEDDDFDDMDSVSLPSGTFSDKHSRFNV